MRMDFTFFLALLLYLAILAAIVVLAARFIKYLIRYGIDYYFQKLDERRSQHPQS